jgi:ABC-2 type transport system permease protein
MSDLAIILDARYRTLVNAARSVKRESRLKVAFISLFAFAFWVGLFEGFREAFYYIGKVPGFENIMTSLVFSLFFMSLLIMLVFSNAVLIYGSLYRSSEVDFLLTLPVKQESIFLYKFIETVFYSSWAFIYLGVPVIIAFGVNRGGPWYFYPSALVMFCVFVVIPAAVGSMISMLLVSFVPKSRFKVIVTVGAVALFVGIFVAVRHFSAPTAYALGYSDLSRLLNKVSFSQNPLLPSLWLSKGVLSLAKAEPKWALFYLTVILSNSLFLTVIAEAASRKLFWHSFSRSRSGAARRSIGKGRVLNLLIQKIFFFLPMEIRLFLAKDLRVFLRDRLQWSQFLIFFGVLGIYIANIRTLPYDLRIEQARSGISLLNLAATCLVLSTFTGRFIFPLLSLEGRNFWVLGLAPVKRSRILYGKFFFAFFGSLAISEVLIFLSDWMLAFPITMWLGHAVLVLAICAGLSAIAVGLGARYPNLKEDNPAKIVAGFGGTLNLIVSMFYIAVMIAAIGYPYQMAFALREVNPAFYHKASVMYLCLGAAAGVLTSVFFLNLGRAQFERMEM